MPSAASKYVTHQELEPVKNEVVEVRVRLEVLTNDVHQLTNQVGDIAEDLGALREDVHGLTDRVTSVETRLSSVETSIQNLVRTVENGHAAIISTVQQLIARR